MNDPGTKYTKVGDAWIGYQVHGDGPIDLVHVTGLASNIEVMWDSPHFAYMLERLASYSRLILFDARGAGVSDPADFAETPTWEHWTEDLRAVLAATGTERAAFLAQLDGGPKAILFAATHPDRCDALILWNSYARSYAAEDYPIGFSPEAAEAIFELSGQAWGTTDYTSVINPSLASDPQHVRWLTKYMRTTSTPGRYVAAMRYVSGIDVRAVLPSVRAPTLVLHRRTNNYIPIAWGRYLADHITGARFVEIPGSDINMFSEGAETILDHIEGFLGVVSPPVDTERVLATVLFTDIVGSTEQVAAMGDRRWKETLAVHDRTARSQIERFRGTYVNTTGDGLLATFDGPGRAIRCAHALGRALEPAGIKIRAGLHTGEIELRDESDVGGIAVHIAARVMHEAGPGEVVCSRTVKDLVAGSEFAFDDRGLCVLKGVPDEWQLYAVRQA